MLTLVILSLASYAFGTVYFTAPTQSTSATGGQALTVSWMDDNTQPNLTEFGAAIAGLYVGDVNTQVKEQLVIATFVQLPTDSTSAPSRCRCFPK